MTDDLALLSAVQRGDRVAFEAIIRQHQRSVFGYLRARLLEAADVEDLTQEVFLRCYQSRARFDDQILIRPWLIGIARNLLREHIRKAKQRKEVAWTALCLELEALVGTRIDAAPAVEEYLPACINELGPSARDALDMRYRAQLRLEQIGERLKRSEGAVKLLMFRARQALKLCLESKVRDGHD
ncbi:MAG TPA: RNA polymerase sigma factor [Pirellulales bacterium]|jgi:RNA polymerase sigma-70 factor (ECF subfamily)|nr:RNA polymerase sigma factor [Pirellulales bacterium]